MNKSLFYTFILGTLLGLTGCWQDRSWQYYEKIQTKTWMYETMQQKYLFYEDMAVLDDRDKIFFRKPSEFLHSVASKRDGKGGVLFSHIDSVKTGSRMTSQYPGFGYEGILVNMRFASQVVPAIRVMYVQKDSPAYRSGFRRGDWIVMVDSMGIKSEMAGEYIDRPTRAHEFYFAQLNERGDGFDTLKTTRVLTPETFEERHVLYDGVVTTEGGRRAYYIMYNEFGEDQEEWKEVFGRMAAETFDDVIVDLRYNPGGYLSTLQMMATNLAPAADVDETFIQLLPADGLDMKKETYDFDRKLLVSGHPLPYRNLYVIATGQTASASEAFINGLRPYMKGNLFQVGTNTFGKNVAQSLYKDDEKAPMLEFWLTSFYVANKENYYDYYTAGLKPDYERPENLAGVLGELGTPADSLMQPVMYHMDHSSFAPVPETKPELKARGYRAGTDLEVVYNSMDRKRKELTVE